MRILLAVGVALSLFPTNPQDDLENKVLTLLEKLRSEEIQVRDAAAKELAALGEKARGLLERAALSQDAEFAARVKAVLKSMRSRKRVAVPNPADRLMNRPKLLGARAETAVLDGLAWLARHQEIDGGWSFAMTSKFAADPCNVGGAGTVMNDDGVTGLAVLAFLGAGYAPGSKEELADPSDAKRKWKPGDVAKKGLDRLRARQRKDGSMMAEDKPLYAHAIATAALCEAAAMTGVAADKDAARRALEYLLDARNPAAAWRYTNKPGDNDTSVTGWCVSALYAAMAAGLWKGDDKVETGILAWLDAVTKAGRAGYNGPGSGKVFIPGKNETFNHHETMTAISAESRRVIEGESDAADLAFITRDLPDAGDKDLDGYFWFWGSLALRRIDGAEGARWQKWNAAAEKTLLGLQLGKGCQHGSWDSDGDRWGFETGRTGLTALNVLTLLTPVR